MTQAASSIVGLAGEGMKEKKSKLPELRRLETGLRQATARIITA